MVSDVFLFLIFVLFFFELFFDAILDFVSVLVFWWYFVLCEQYPVCGIDIVKH